jgi:hypothetical protein
MHPLQKRAVPVSCVGLRGSHPDGFQQFLGLQQWMASTYPLFHNTLRKVHPTRRPSCACVCLRIRVRVRVRMRVRVCVCVYARGCMCVHFSLPPG